MPAETFAGIILSAFVFASQAASANTWYVSASVQQSGDGTSWETAFQKIQQGIDAASADDTVIVAQGTYIENVQFKGKNIVLTSADPLDPDVIANTIVDGGKAGPVVTFSGSERATCALSGFTIRNGSSPNGGGIRGMWQTGTHTRATIRNNVISGNFAPEAGASGGGIFCCDGIIENNVIEGNSAEDNIGAGLFDCDGTIRNNIITRNSTRWGRGGGLDMDNGTIENNIIIENSSSLNWGGGLFLCNGTIQNNLIAANSGGQWGGGLSDCDGTIRNNTIVGNSAGTWGGGLDQCDGTILNCIIWGNVSPTGGQLTQSSTPSYSCIQGWAGDPKKRNIADDPKFVDADGPDNNPATYPDNDYRLRADSPCIDKGANQDWMQTAVDLDSRPCISRGKDSWTVDMGAYEYGADAFRITQLAVGEAGRVDLIWNSRPGDTYAVWSRFDLLTATWVEEATIPSGGDLTVWIDPNTGFTRKFYRIGIE